MKDFTLKTYILLLETLKSRNYTFLPFSSFLETKSVLDNLKSSIVILRHDVDRLPANSLVIAKLEHELGINGTYYFRIVRKSFNETIIKQIAELGHEIGYHYEDVDLVSKKSKSLVAFGVVKGKKLNKDELVDLAYESFCKNLEMFRQNFDVKTICMHGSPLSKYDNKIIWEKYSYKDLGIIGEPYFDINWNEFGYLTDTGRSWNGKKFSVRDKVKSKYDFNFKTTQKVIDNIDKLPDKIMITIHPERWTDDWFLWSKQLVFQNIKNVVKRFLVN